MVWLQNPSTGRNILKGGPTYNRLKREGYKVDSFTRARSRYPKRRKSPARKTAKRKSPRKRASSPKRLRKPTRRASPSRLRPSMSPGKGRGGATKGWGAAAPKRGKERHDLMNKCGRQCFLQPENEGFPVCAALREGQGCKVDCRGVTAALSRARQHKRGGIAQRARAIQQRRCGK